MDAFEGGRSEPGGRWTAQNISPANGNLAFPVEDDLGTGVRAWQVADQSAVATNPSYSASLTPAEATLATSSGWRLASRARYVYDFGDAANLGISAFLGGVAYELRFDLTASGDLPATLIDQVPRVRVLSSGGTGPLAYHDFALQFDPATSLTNSRFDGAVVDAWDGVPTLLQDSIQWGNSVGATRGIMNYQSVVFDVGRSALAGPGD